MALSENGVATRAELKSAACCPSDKRYEKGPVAVVECLQEIPCNPCESACKFGAIRIGEPITNLPELDEARCTGCGICVAKCPGLAIFIVDKTFAPDTGTVAFPYEYEPLPADGERVNAVNRSGIPVCKGAVVKVQNPGGFDHTPVVTLAIPVEYADEVRGLAPFSA
jgi:Fe-S-cluster-containing hydrogenase component 2